jgi:UDP-glucose:(heptosyl)LPS alpha-1,3-glucosyltransferase
MTPSAPEPLRSVARAPEKRAMKLAVIANRVYRIGGMERATAEVFSRIASTAQVTIVATQCELADSQVTWQPVRSIQRPAFVNQAHFSRAAAASIRGSSFDLTISVDSAAREADIVISHFCQAVFSQRFGGIRGGANPVRRAYQSVAEQVMARHERHLYTSPRLRGVIAVSEGLKRELVAHYGIPESKIRVIPNGVDRLVFHPPANPSEKALLRRTLGLPERSFLAVFLGGDWGRKGLADVIRAMSGLPDMELVVVGRGNAEAFGKVAREAGAESRVHFAGVQRQPERYLAAADVFVVPSRYETFSMSGIEAAASGLPLIVVRTNGLEDFVEHGVNGFFVEPAAESVRDALSRVMSDPKLRARMSAAAIRTSERFDWGAIAEETRVYLEAMARVSAA